jgi:hypothetical protein
VPHVMAPSKIFNKEFYYVEEWAYSKVWMSHIFLKWLHLLLYFIIRLKWDSQLLWLLIVASLGSYWKVLGWSDMFVIWHLCNLSLLTSRIPNGVCHFCSLKMDQAMHKNASLKVFWGEGMQCGARVRSTLRRVRQRCWWACTS